MGNPVIAASGAFGYAREFAGLTDINKLGAIVTKTITLNSREGNPPPRLAETASGLINAIGLQNKGIDNFLKDDIPYLRTLKTRVIVSIAGANTREFAELSRRLDIDGVAGLELNLSCPNIGMRRMFVGRSGRRKGVFGAAKVGLIAQDARRTYRAVFAARRATQKTIIAKLSPNVGDISLIARAAEQAGADSVCIANTFLAMAMDTKTRRPRLANITGGLSGPAIRPIALRMVWQACQDIDIPVIGCGGIMSAQDALEFLVAGASAVEVGTANLVDPQSGINIIRGIGDYLRERKIKCLSCLRWRQ